MLESTPTPLSLTPLVQLPPRPTPALPRLKGESPALAAMTDFSQDSPAVVIPGRHIDDALQDMIAYGVRALLVVQGEGVIGLITAGDIMGERPIQFLQSPLCEGRPCRHKDIHVADVMTRWADLRPLEFDWVARSTVADVAEMLIGACETHLLVVERSADGAHSVLRGLFSRSRIERQLDRALPNPC
jgi:CBS domain-containing protein